MSALSTYQGGISPLYTRYGQRQRGSGFLSGLKRFLIPLARTALPHLAGAVGDLIAGRPALDSLKDRARAAGADVLEEVGNVAADAVRRRPKGIKRKAAPRKGTRATKKTRGGWNN